MSKGLDEFKDALICGDEFEGQLGKIKSIEDVYMMAKENGYDFTLEELEDSEISDDILDCVAGGKGDSSRVKVTRMTTPKAKNTDVIFRACSHKGINYKSKVDEG